MPQHSWILKVKHLSLKATKKLFIVVICISILILIIATYFWQLRSQYIFHHPYFNYNLQHEEPTDPRMTCVLPKIHPFDQSIWSYVTQSHPIKCRHGLNYLTYVKNGYIHYNHTAILSAGYSVLHCAFQVIVRRPGSDDEVDYLPKVDIPQEGIAFSGDFVFVSCYNFAKIIVYSTIHAHIRDLPKIENSTFAHQAINVITFGLDSMSRLSFIRLLPKTYQFLTETMKATVFRGMNKVGDNTFPNLIAMLTGKEAYGGKLPPESKFDEWPCIWKNYSKNGYITLFAEDFPTYGLFNYLAPGLRNTPTDYYLRPFWLAVEHSSVHQLSSHLCFGPTPKHLLQMQYLEDFVVKYSNMGIPYFAFSFLAEISHEYMSRVASADQDFVNMLHRLFYSGVLNQTVFIFMSDHGHRFDSIRQTSVGRVEERMPFFSIYIPPFLSDEQQDRAEILKSNVGKLITHYDVYSTLIDILQYSLLGNFSSQHSSEYGLSLFSKVPFNRTCFEAGIPEHYCICGREVPMNCDLPEVNKIAKTVINKINSMIKEKNGNKCAKLSVGYVRSASQLISHPSIMQSSSDYKISILVVAEPSKGLFEATVHVSGDHSHQILGDISRINEYGNQSWCIQDSILRKYCYCQDDRE